MNKPWNPRKLIATIALWLLFIGTYFLRISNLIEDTTSTSLWSSLLFILALAFSLMKE